MRVSGGKKELGTTNATVAEQDSIKTVIIIESQVANIVQQERNLSQQVPVHLVVPANTKIKIM